MNEEYTDHYFSDEEDDEDTLANKFLIFHIENERYGLEIRYITDIIGFIDYTEIPEMPEYIKGVINLRGRVIPLVDVRLRFHLVSKEYNDRTCIIIINIENKEIGLIVDSVAEIVEIQPKDIAPPPKFKSTTMKNRYVMGLGKLAERVHILLDVRKMVYEEDMDLLDNVTEEEQTIEEE